MKEFHLYGNGHKPLEIKEGFPKNELEKYGFPGALKFHAIYNKLPLLFQTIKVGEEVIANSDYLVRDDGKFEAKSDESCIELHFLLTGAVQINLNGCGWNLLESGSHNLTTLPSVHSQVYFKRTPVSTFDIHITESRFAALVAKNPQITHLLTAYKAKQEATLDKHRIKTNAFMFHLIVQLRTALRAGLENEPSTVAMLERLICMVIEDQTSEYENHYSYEDIEKIQRAYLQLGMNLDEKATLSNIVRGINMKKAKFREGFKLLFGRLPSHYLQEKRLEKAYKLAIEDRETTITGIANLCGYDSSRHLSKVFFKHYGIKLSDIFKKNRENDQ